MNDSLYKEIILEHGQYPLNYGILENAAIDVTENNPLCGDQIRLTINLLHDTLSDIQFTAEGCIIVKSSASLFTERIKGMNIKDVLEISQQQTLDLLGVTLTPSRTKCALLIYKTTHKALLSHSSKKKS